MRNDAGIDLVPCVSQEAVPVGQQAFEDGRRFSGTATDVASQSIDVERACFEPGEAIDVTLEVDGPTVVSFSDGRSSVSFGASTPSPTTLQGVDSVHSGTYVTEREQPACDIAAGAFRRPSYRGIEYAVVALTFAPGCTYTLTIHPDGFGSVLAGQTP